jgi:hypothetical protein
VQIGDVWVVHGVPPAPWPQPGYGYASDPQFGPPGTVWVFNGSDITDRITGLPGSAFLLKQLLADYLAKWCRGPRDRTLLSWVVQDGSDPSDESRFYGMRWVHATIIGQLDTNEQVAHTLNFRTAPAPDVDQDAAAMLTLGGQIRDAWVTFLNSTTSSGTVKSNLAATLKYTEVRTAYLEQTEPAAITTHTSRKTGHPVKDFAYPRPAYLVPTQYTAFTGTTGQCSGANPLPYEVAGVVSLQTGLRGPRNRGRVYLGPFGSVVLGTQGDFNIGITSAIAANFGAFVHTLNTATGVRLHVVSRAYATSVGVNGVTMGQVPDSQRRRRRSRLELFPPTVVT